MPNTKKKRQPATAEASNRLIGWLVSYEMDSMGKAYEIRTGRTFIGSDDIAPDQNFIALADETICSMHSAMNASPRHRVVVQDIFSEHGTFLSRAGSNSEKPVNGPIELEHGDWIRIGNKIRFQLCLIDAPVK